MVTLIFGFLVAASLGPMGNDAAHTPQLATNGATVGLAFGAGNAIYYTASHDAGKTFMQPVRVATADIVPLTRHRGPRVVLAGNDIIITAVMGKTPSHEQHAHGLPSDGDLVAWKSIDGGKTWSAGTTVNDVPGAPTEGLHALASDGKATVFAAWLDKRSGKGPQLYGAVSHDRGKNMVKEHKKSIHLPRGRFANVAIVPRSLTPMGMCSSCGATGSADLVTCTLPEHTTGSSAFP